MNGNTRQVSEGRIIDDVGGVVDETRVWLGIYGPELDPAEISRRLGVDPTSSHRRGESRPSGGPWPSGAWLLMREGAPAQQPEEIVRRMLDELPGDPATWALLRERYEVRFTFGLHLDAFNQGFDLAPEVLDRLAATGAVVGFDIYADGEDLGALSRDIRRR